MGFIEECIGSMDLSDKTRPLYIQRMKRLHELMGVEGEIEDLKFLLDLDAVVAALEGLTLSQKKNTLITVISCLTHCNACDLKLHKRYKEVSKEITTEYLKNSYDQEVAEKDKPRWVSFDKLNDRLDQMDRKVRDLQRSKENTGETHLSPSEKRLLNGWLILALNTLIPPRRAEYGCLRVLKPNQEVPEDENSLEQVSPGKYSLHFVNYKTAKRHGHVEIECPARLNHILQRSLEMWPRPYLFVRCDDATPAGNHWYSRLVTKALPEATNVGTFRKIWMTERFKNDTSYQERAELGRQMGNSPGTIAQFYEKKKGF